MNRNTDGQLIDWNDLFGKHEFWRSFYARQLACTGASESSPPDFLRRYLAELDFTDAFATRPALDSEASALTIEIAFPAQFRLVSTLALDGDRQTLQLSYPDYSIDPAERHELLLGCDDSDCGAAYSALRWAELMVITRCFERLPELPFELHYFFLLLKKFTPTVEADDWARIEAGMAEVCRATKLFNELEIMEFAAATTIVQADLIWIYDEERGFVATGGNTDAPRYYDSEPTVLFGGTGEPGAAPERTAFNFPVFRLFIREMTSYAGVSFLESGIPLRSKDGEHPLSRLWRVLEAYSATQLGASEANLVRDILQEYAQAFDKLSQLSPKTTMIALALVREFLRETAKYGYQQLEYVETPEQIAEIWQMEKQIKQAMRGKLIEFLDAQADEWQEIIGFGDEESSAN